MLVKAALYLTTFVQQMEHYNQGNFHKRGDTRYTLLLAEQIKGEAGRKPKSRPCLDTFMQKYLYPTEGSETLRQSVGCSFCVAEKKRVDV